MGTYLPYINFGTGILTSQLIVGGFHRAIISDSDQIKLFGWGGQGFLTNIPFFVYLFFLFFC